jgi:type IV pilus assembly protein PilB
MVTKKRLGELLLEAGVIDEAMLQSALGHQRRWGGRLGQALLDLKLVSEAVIVEALSRKSGIEVARLNDLEPYALEQATKLVPREFAQRNNVFPMAADTSSITVAMSDPTNLALTDELRFRTGRRVKVCIGGDREIAEAIRSHYSQDYQAPASIALDIENTGGDGLPLAEPFEGGSTEDMRAMLEPTRHEAARPATTPVPAPPVPSAAPALVRPAVSPPAPSVASAVPVAAPRPVPSPAGPPTLGRPGVPAPASGPAVTRPIPTRPPGATPPVGAIPRGGFAPEEPYEELTPAPPDEEASLPDDLLVPEEEMVEGRVPIRELSPGDVAILDALDALARGEVDPASPVSPARLAAALLRLLLQKRLITEQELLDELARP